MELATTPMTERQRKYRDNYRERVAGWYNGWLHILLIYIIGFTALYVYIANLHNVRWWEYLAIPVVFMFANFFEWAVHRYAMHAAPKSALHGSASGNIARTRTGKNSGANSSFA
jgi:hypothetical protein